MDIKCKKCNSSAIVKNGFVRDKQRYKCKECKYNFIEKDERIISDMEKKKALSILLYSQGKGSFRFIAKLLKVSKMTVLRWIKKEAEDIPYPEIKEDVIDVEFDEVWHFVKKNLKKFAIRVFEPNKKMDYMIGKACHNTAYEILDNITSSVDDNTFREYENKLTNYLKEKYGDFIKEFLTEFYDAEGDELGGKYVFAKHSERQGGTGFMSSYNTWNELL